MISFKCYCKIVIITIFSLSQSIFLFAENLQPGQGFILYCPCMGRFGNQAEQLLGSLYFAKLLNRTLVLPPFIYYGLSQIPTLIPFEDIIQVEPLQTYHEVLLLKDFMEQYAPTIWPSGKRRFYCYSNRDSGGNSCDALKGQPFNTFWTNFNISEDDSVFYKPLITNARDANSWRTNYPVSSHPVLVFVGAPSPFPTDKESIPIQKYINLSPNIQREAFRFREKMKFSHKPYISMHIRHGLDWRRACELLRSTEGLSQLFSSNQCTGYDEDANLHGTKIQYDTCLPSFETITSKLDDTLRDLKTSNQTIDISVVHIATDVDDAKLWKKLRDTFSQLEFVRNPTAADDIIGTMIDIYLMAHADIFIGNCISSFSAFPARIRTEQLGLKHKTFYFGQSFVNEDQKLLKDEL